ncbi:MAG: DUF262 domain-containing protein [Methanocellales archaeon]|nr:DUF262 domain-containing protein [Methanocellales archaeon]
MPITYDIVRVEPKTIYDLYGLYRDEKITWNTEYQRSEVWKEPKKQKLIDSIIKGYSIGMIFFRKKDDKYEVLDGQQRLRSIFDYMNDDFPTSSEFTPEFAEKKYSELEQDRERYPGFIAHKITVAEISDVDDETTADIFLRLQEGVPLNTAEKLNASRGKMRNLIVELSNHPLLGKTDLDDKRFGYRLICAQIANLELNCDLEYIRFPDIKYENLRDMYGRYKDRNPPSWLPGKIKRTFNFLLRTLNDDAQLIYRRGDFLPIYLLASYINEKYVISEEEKLKEFVRDFLANVDNINIRDENLEEDKKPYRDYKFWRSAGALSSKSFKERFDIILGKFLEYVPDLLQKDDQRLFDYGQKLAIYHRDKGKCRVCNQKVEFNNAEFHHVTEWADGGRTTVENGILVHPEHHPR